MSGLTVARPNFEGRRGPLSSYRNFLSLISRIRALLCCSRLTLLWVFFLINIEYTDQSVIDVGDLANSLEQCVVND